MSRITHNIRHLTFLAVSLMLVCSLCAGFVRAEDNPQKIGGVTVAPAFQEIAITGNSKRTNSDFTLTNNEPVAVDFSISSVDMGALDDTGGVIFSGLPSDYQKRYGLAQWLELPQTKITLAGHSTKTIPFYIKNSQDLQPGGHYGAIIVRPSVDQQTEGGNRISLSPQAATLLFVRKVGGEIFKLNLESAQVSSGFWHPPRQATLRLKNTGNVHVVPRGIVQVVSSNGKIVGQGVLNQESSLILPERSRTFTVPITYEPGVVWPGRYSVRIQYRFDGQTEFMKAQTTTTIINLPVVLALVAIIAIIVVLIVWLQRRFKYRIRAKLISMGILKRRVFLTVPLPDIARFSKLPRLHPSKNEAYPFVFWQPRGEKKPVPKPRPAAPAKAGRQKPRTIQDFRRHSRRKIDVK